MELIILEIDYILEHFGNMYAEKIYPVITKCNGYVTLIDAGYIGSFEKMRQALV